MDGEDHIYDRTYSDTKGRFRMVVTRDYRGIVRGHGTGSMDGARALVRFGEEVLDIVGRGGAHTAMIDLTEVVGAPFRAQFVLGKWMLRRKTYLRKVAVFGGRPWEMSLARAVARIARMKHVGFFATEDEAVRFLDW